MSAKNGWTHQFRKGVGICLALALIGSAILASSASAKKPVLKPTNIIAMGDSITYGYSQQKFEEAFPAENPEAFEGGFVNLVAKKLAGKEKKAGNGLSPVNLSCPGELSDGLIGENPGLGGGGENSEGPDSAPCGWHNEDGFPRHAEYGPASQLEAALGTLLTPEDETKAITMQIGSNDELAAVGRCLNPAYRAARGMTLGEFECLTVEAGPPPINEETKEEEFEGDKLKGKQFYNGGLFPHIITNLGTAVQVLRTGPAKYAGPIVILGFYNPQALLLPGSDALQKKLNEALENVILVEGKFGPGVFYANPFTKFNPQKGNAKEGAAICKYTEECNPHDHYVNFIKYLTKKFEAEYKMSHEEAEANATAYAEAHKTEAEEFPEGDIHPSAKGHKWLAKIIEKALLKGESTL